MGSKTLLAVGEECGAYAFENIKNGWKRTPLGPAKQNWTADCTQGLASYIVGASSDFIATSFPCTDSTGSCKSPRPIYVYKRPKWQAPLKVDAPANSTYTFGNSVAISNQFLVVGDPQGGADKQGTVYVSQYSKNKWQNLKAIVVPKGAGPEFGRVVAMSGNLLAVASSGNTTYIYQQKHGAWNLQASIQSPLEKGFNYLRLALSGNTLATVGLSNNLTLFRKSGASWKLEGNILIKDPEGNFDGCCGFQVVALGGDNTALAARVGDPREGINAFTGVYIRSKAGKWTLRTELTNPKGYGYDLYGRSVAANGNVFVVGAPGTDGEAKRSINYYNTVPGSAYIYTQKLN